MERTPGKELPPGTTEAVVVAVGRLSEAIEWVERARGRLYDFHQMIGHADEALGVAARQLRDAGREDLARRLDEEHVGRNVVEGRWTFEIVEDFDRNYWIPVREFCREVEEETVGGVRHAHEALMKQRRQSGESRDGTATGG